MRLVLAGGLVAIVAWLGLVGEASAALDPATARCTIKGTDGPDELVGTPGKDVICARGGDDLVRAGAGNDIIRGGWGADELHGYEGRDVLVGGTEADALDGGPGVNRCDDEELASGPNLCVGYYALKELTLDDHEVNTDTKRARIGLTARIENTDPHPVPTKELWASFGGQPDTGLVGWAIERSGDTTDGIWKGEIGLPRRAPVGSYDIGIDLTVGVFDDEHRISLTPEQLRAAGFQASFSNVGLKSNAAPRILGIDAPTEVDASQSDQIVPIRMHLVDDRRVRYGIDAQLAMDGGPLFRTQFDLESGDSRDGIWIANLRIPQGTRPGVIRFTEITVPDLFMIERLDTDDLAQLPIAVPEFNQVGPGDSTPPVLRSFSVDTDHVDVTQGGRVSIGVHVDATDDSGQASSRVFLWRSVDPTWAAIGGFMTPYNPTGAIQFPFNDEGIGRAAGDYGIYVSLADPAGNERIYDPDELSALGFPAYIHNGP